MEFLGQFCLYSFFLRRGSSYDRGVMVSTVPGERQCEVRLRRCRLRAGCTLTAYCVGVPPRGEPTRLVAGAPRLWLIRSGAATGLPPMGEARRLLAALVACASIPLCDARRLACAGHHARLAPRMGQHARCCSRAGILAALGPGPWGGDPTLGYGLLPSGVLAPVRANCSLAALGGYAAVVLLPLRTSGSSFSASLRGSAHTGKVQTLRVLASSLLEPLARLASLDASKTRRSPTRRLAGALAKPRATRQTSVGSVHTTDQFTTSASRINTGLRAGCAPLCSTVGGSHIRSFLAVWE